MATFQTKVQKINSTFFVRIPKSESAKLPSRGMVMVKGKINNFDFQEPLEPDGKGSHIYVLDDKFLKQLKAGEGDSVSMQIETTKDWTNPEVPKDLKKALTSNQPIHRIWVSLTPMARWDWIRWINGTKNPETRAIRIEKTLSKMKGGTKRPCCFNRTECTNPSISQGGILVEL